MRRKYHRPDDSFFESNRRYEQAEYYDPSEYNYAPGRYRNYQRGLPDSCAFALLKIAFVLSIVVFLLIALHPQGYPLIPWLLSHWPVSHH